MEPGQWHERYLGGAREEVWAALVELGDGVREAGTLPHARAVARETMERARRNLETIVSRLRAAGYRFQYPDDVHVPPTPAELARLDGFEAETGPIPLSLRAFYEVVGTVDLTQSWEQLVQWWPEEERARATELELLGEQDPLAVGPVFREGEHEDTPGWYFLGLDEFHKANYSGGENYHVVLPDPAADFALRGVSRVGGGKEVDELFVQYLRASFAGGGFRGHAEPRGDSSTWAAPPFALSRDLAAGLEPL